MLRSLENLLKLRVAAMDVEMGRAADFLFDDWEWNIRYLVVDVGDWPVGRRVLISPVSIARADWGGPTLHLNLSKEQLVESPGIDADAPISRQREKELASHYVWPMYWESTTPATAQPGAHGPKTGASAVEGDPRFRSANEVFGYGLRASDGDIGHVADFLLNDEDWRILYMVVDTRNWLPGRHVLIAPMWIQNVRWDERMVHVGLSRREVEGSPEYDPVTPVNRDYETELYNYYGRPKYWS
ncbi:MAG: PRC-barrel domain containing protein [Phycisphaerae bacterium]|nr:PRC-barrel domain containing protein [Phycisphaerae bacterium]